MWLARLLAARRQRSGETLDEFLMALKTLSKDCNFRDVTATVYRDEAVRDAFITGLQSNPIRQRLLENSTLDLKTMFTQARSLETAQKNSESYGSFSPPPIPTAAMTSSPKSIEEDSETITAATSGAKCYFCGYSKHPRQKCPAKEAICRRCQNKGHFAKVCRSNPVSSQSAQGGASAAMYPTLATTTSDIPSTLIKSSCEVTINGVNTRALIDSCSTESFIHPRLADTLRLQKYPVSREISMAQSSLSAKTLGHCNTELELCGRMFTCQSFLACALT